MPVADTVQGLQLIGCNMRNLQRKLAIEQTTYSEVVDNVRCRAAMSRLRDSELNLNEIARKLGYCEHADAPEPG